ncbi:NAD-dependent epimerase/dehydratase family protein [Brucella intermedia]|uniref:NAD-dependent epimerase/dehydratase family protein n=1 Tax=Brucella intermedia TaxID=94625 RepID=UPI002554F047|nr:NAD-dependent epimerase/dehydratase family protein [Brucella intermedia]MDL2202011.1 NAD-dependent epimerase/dehydratase family protein [Brucella intermedia]
MKILVLGGLGFVGRHTVKKLISNGYSVRVFDRTMGNNQALGLRTGSDSIEFMAGEFTDKNLIRQALDGCQACVHLVTTTVPATSNADKIYDVNSNLIGTLQVLDAMHELNIKKIVFISSGGTVYGNPIYTPIDEEHPTNPLSSYGIVKLTIEKYCQLYNDMHNLNSIVLRLSNPYGPGQSGTGIQGAIPVFTRKALLGQPIELWGDGNIVRDYIYIDDVTDAIVSSITYQGKERVFNIGSGLGMSLNHIITSIRALVPNDVLIDYKPARSLDVSISVLNVNKAFTELGWKPNVSFELGIQSVIEDQKAALELSALQTG